MFVTGTDTGVGKTVASAWLVRKTGARYWKPIQSGIADGADYQTVLDLNPGIVIEPTIFELTAPRSPHEAAAKDGVAITLDRIKAPPGDSLLVTEGAGGVLVPLNDDTLMIDLMKTLGFPVIVVARSTLGTINHTLLTLEALRARDLTVAGVIMNGPFDPENRAALVHYGGVPILCEMPPLIPLTTRSLDEIEPQMDLGACIDQALERTA